MKIKHLLPVLALLLFTACSKKTEPEEIINGGKVVFDGVEDELNTGYTFNVGMSDYPGSERFHTLVLYSKDIQSTDPDSNPTGTGVMLTFIFATDSDHTDDIVGEFTVRNEGDYSNAPDYSWTVITGMKIEDGKTVEDYSFEGTEVSQFTITKEGEAYNITIKGAANKMSSNEEATANFEVTYKGSLLKIDMDM